MTFDPNRKLKVFLCHSSNDNPAVRELYQRLKGEGRIDPWLDEEKLYPRQDWDLEIEKAVEAADAVIVFLSNNSVTKEGYIHRELRFVLRIADFKPEGTVFVIPIRLDDCPMPRRLSMWQYVDFFPEDRVGWAYNRLLGSLKVRANKLEIPTINPAEAQAHHDALEKVEKEYREGKEGLKREEKARIEKETREKAEIEERVSNTPKQKANKEPKDQVVQNAYSKHEMKVEQWLDKLNIGYIEFLRIPKGKFTMGEGEVAHEVDIAYDYFLAHFLVTNRLFRKFVDTTGFNKSWGVSKWNEKLDHPVVSVSWRIAQDFCKWLSEEYARELPDGYAIRLPTEAEWEKAARGPDTLLWPWGDKFDQSKCNSRESQLYSTTPIGKYSPQGNSTYGIADMAGNVWEWTHSLFQPYPYNPDDGRESVDTYGSRVLRGGSLFDDALNTRTFSGGRNDSDFLGDRIGFRVVLAPPLPK